ncbi:hypothetical protein BDV96DRAFT_516703 [Lophiotrema nucula]|uniref:F-box domain-containing protein n=1 Tax=Lophiotrema nucula TaxID=690887 RepID=A0A6A5ZHQ6_9PLEO|nr:hypothetical protein BDV96DRAFT_516703 [Lophiotrema nucula]
MHLLDLAPELLECIIDYTLPLGFEGFALCCKTTHTLSQAKIALHNHYKQKWRVANASARAAGDPFGLLYEIALDPLLAKYIEVFNFGDWNREAMLTVRHNDEVMIKIKDLLISSPYFRLADVDFQEWWTELEEEFQRGRHEDSDAHNDFPYATISLLLFLPNIIEIKFAEAWGSSRWYIDNDAEKKARLRDPVLDSIVELSHGSAFEGRSLNRLETVLPFMRGGYNTKTGFQAVEPFVLIPSVKELYSTSLVATEKGLGISFSHPFSRGWQNPNIISGLRRMELAYCCMDGGTLDTILEKIPRLETFRYEHECKHHGVEYEWDAASFVETLGKRCGNTLTELAITSSQAHIGGIENGAETFEVFEKLERLEIDVRIFMGPPKSSGQKRGFAGFSPEGTTLWQEADLPNLANILPPSIKSLDMNTDFPKDGDMNDKDAVALNALLKGFREQRQKILPNLERVVVRQMGAESAKRLADEAGCDFEIYRADNTGGRILGRSRGSFRAKWIRDFDERVGGVSYEY